MDVEIRPVTADEVPHFLRTEANGFGLHVEDEDLPWLMGVFEPDRSLGVFDAGRLVGTAEAAKVLPDLHERLRLAQNGDNSRSEAWWTGYLSDPKFVRHGRSALFFVLHETAKGHPDGYATWRIKEEETEGAGNELWVENLRGLSDDTDAALWRFVFDIDLVGDVIAGVRGPDDALRWRLLDPRRLRVTEQVDMLWLR